MPRTISRLAAAVCVFSTSWGLGPGPRASADEPAPTVALPNPSRHPTSRPVGGKPGASTGSGGFWLGSAGVAVALAAFGGLSLATKKLRPSGGDSPTLRVVGRAGLSPKHSVYLLRVGDRVLIVGAGGQGPPSLLGEITDSNALGRLIPDRSPGGAGGSS